MSGSAPKGLYNWGPPPPPSFLAPEDPADPAMVHAAMERLWFDLAGTPMPVQVETIIRRVGTGRLLYGSDFCWTPQPLVAAQVASLDEGWADEAHGPWRPLVGENAARLWPSFTDTAATDAAD